jgi:hypothetical protein
MSKLELKGNILELIAGINNKESLEELSRIVNEFAGNHSDGSDFAEEISDLELKNLTSAIENSKNEKNLIDHKSVMKRFRK